MVVKMPSRKYRASADGDNKLTTDLKLLVFAQPPVEPWPMKMSWETAMRAFAATREHYMREFDSPHRRWRDKNPEPFRL